MTFDLQAGKARLGIAAGDTTKDAFVTAALNGALALAEAYCDRKFMFTTEVATFTHSTGSKFQLARYPIEQIISFTTDTGAAVTGYHSQDATGLVIADSPIGAHQVSIGYAAGYRVLPDDLLLALWLIFDQLYAPISQVGAAATSVGGGVVKAITSAGSRVEFDTSSGAGGGGFSGLNASTGLPMGAAAILSYYRRESA